MLPDAACYQSRNENNCTILNSKPATLSVEINVIKLEAMNRLQLL